MAETAPPATEDKVPSGILAPVTVLIKTVGSLPADKLVLLSLISVVGVLLYGFVWVIPVAHQDAIGVIQNSNEQQRELDRKAMRENSDLERRDRRESNEKLRNTMQVEHEKTRESHTRDAEKMRAEFRQGIDEIKRTKSGGGFPAPPDDNIIGPPAPSPRVKVGSPKDE